VTSDRFRRRTARRALRKGKTMTVRNITKKRRVKMKEEEEEKKKEEEEEKEKDEKNKRKKKKKIWTIQPIKCLLHLIPLYLFRSGENRLP